MLRPAESAWRDCRDALVAWTTRGPVAQRAQHAAALERELARLLGEPTSLTRWQVRQAAARIDSFLGGPVYREIESGEMPDTERAYAAATHASTLRDTVKGKPAELPLSVAIDMLMPCHWDFERNLRLVLGAIGGTTALPTPFCACGRNIERAPWRDDVSDLCASLRRYGSPGSRDRLASRLGPATPGRRWLVASLEKTLRGQLRL